MLDWKQEIIARLEGLDLSPAREAEIVEELAQHLGDRYRDLRGLGMTEHSAHRAVLAELGRGKSLRQELRRVENSIKPEAILLGGNRRSNMIADLWQDLRYGFRSLRKNPGFTAVAIVMLGLGIGANTAIFSVINTVLLSPLPFPDPDRLVAVQARPPADPSARESVSYPDVLDWDSQNHVFERVSAYRSIRPTLTGAGEAVRLSGVESSPWLFAVLGVSPELGRTFNPDEDQPGIGNVVVIADRLWRNQFSGDPQIIGRGIVLNSRSYTVIGVMPPGFGFPVGENGPELWTTIAYEKLDTPPGEQPNSSNRGIAFFHAIARLRPGASLETAGAEIDQIAAALNEQYPDVAPRKATVVPLLDTVVGDVRPAMTILFVAVGVVLLIACANVSNLLLSRLTARQQEISIRVALGASSGRVARQLLTENLLLSSLGGGFGLVLACLGILLLMKLSPTMIPRITSVTLDLKVLEFAALTVLVTGILFGVAPALQATRGKLAERLKSGGRGETAGSRHYRFRQAVMAGEVALTVVLLSATSLLLQSLFRLQRINPGFSSGNVLTAGIVLPSSQYSNDQGSRFYRQLLTDIRQIPGVRSAGGIVLLPLSGKSMNTSFEIDGHPQPRSERPRVYVNLATPDYFRTLQIPLKTGREFTEADNEKAPRVAVVNEALASRFFPGTNPIGQRIKQGIGDDVYQIVGVTGNLKSLTLAGDPEPEVYLPFAQLPVTNQMTLVVSTEVSPLSITGAVREKVHALDNAVPVSEVKPLDQYARQYTEQSRFNSVLLLVFGSMALIMTVVGLYGVISYSVAQRTQELGVRIALGAKWSDIFRMVIGQAVLLAGTGIALGSAGAVISASMMRALLFGVSPRDPITIAAVPLLLIGVTLLACYVPASRAARVDPMSALRIQ
jgi:putative ABC transport system permease protein